MLTLEMVRSAQSRIAPYVRRTRLERNSTLSDRFSTSIYLKLELFQKTGSFKSRGAINQILVLGEAERRSGVVGVSGGNFAQGASYAGRELGIPVRICMAEGTPANYVEATRSYGAEVFFSPSITEAFEQARRFEGEGWSYIDPFAHPEMMAGNGTVGLEILEDLPETTDVIVSIGGGGPDLRGGHRPQGDQASCSGLGGRDRGGRRDGSVAPRRRAGGDDPHLAGAHPGRPLHLAVRLRTGSRPR